MPDNPEMKIICAWCKQEGRGGVLGEREPIDDPTETHGVCALHAEKLIEQLPSPSFPGLRMLIVVRRTEIALYRYLTQSLVAVPNAAVILNRRERERRKTPGPVVTERRRVNRRIRRSEFSSLGYLVVRFGPEHQEALTAPPLRKLRIV